MTGGCPSEMTEIAACCDGCGPSGAIGIAPCRGSGTRCPNVVSGIAPCGGGGICCPTVASGIATGGDGGACCPNTSVGALHGVKNGGRLDAGGCACGGSWVGGKGTPTVAKVGKGGDWSACSHEADLP